MRKISFFIFIILINSSLYGFVCFTANNGPVAEDATRKAFENNRTKLIDKVDELGKLAEKRAEKEIEIKKLNEWIRKVRTENLKLIKEINFYIKNRK